MKLGTLLTAAATTAGLLLGPATAAGATAPTTSQAPLAAYTFDYESGAQGWVTKKDANLRDGKVTWSTTQAKSGTHSLQFWMDGLNDDGTMWLERRFPVPFGRTSVTVELSFWEWNEVDSSVNTWPIIAHAGRSAPTKEEDFTQVGRTQYAGWRQYTYRTTVDVRGLTSFYLSFGLSATWESERTNYFDLANVTIT